MTSSLNKKDLYKKIPGMLKIASVFGVVHKIPNFQKFIKELLANRMDIASEILLKLRINPEDLQKEMFGDIKDIAVGYITQGKFSEMSDLKNLLKISSENMRDILLLAIKEQLLNPNHTNIKSFVEKRDFGFNINELREDLVLKENIKQTMGEMIKMSFSPNGKDVKVEARKLGEVFGIKTEPAPGEKKDRFGGSKFGADMDFSKFDNMDFGDLKL